MNSVESGVVHEAIRELFEVAFYGPREGSFTWFADNEPDSGMIGCLRKIDAATASRPPGEGRRTIVGHARHVLVHVESSLAFLRGDRGAVDWPASFEPAEANEAQWRELLDRLDRSSRELLDGIRQLDLARHDNLCGAMGAFTHAAYHLGAVRQMRLDLRRRTVA